MKKQLFLGFVALTVMLSASGMSYAANIQLNPDLLQLQAPDDNDQPIDPNLDKVALVNAPSINEPTKGESILTGDLLTVSGTCVSGAQVYILADLVDAPIQTLCQNDAFIVEGLQWDPDTIIHVPKDEGGGALTDQGERKITAYQVLPNNVKSPYTSVSVHLYLGGSGGGCQLKFGCITDFKAPEPGEPVVFEITTPKEGQGLNKENSFVVSGQCNAGKDLFFEANVTTNPFYAKCTPQGTFTASDLKWLSSVQKGSSQTISGKQMSGDKVTATDQVSVKINGKQAACDDGIDNDNDGLFDGKDPGCHTDGDIENDDSYDPNDDDENDEFFGNHEPYGRFTYADEPFDGSGRIMFSADIGDQDQDPLKINIRYVAVNPGQECPVDGWSDAQVVGPLSFIYPEKGEPGMPDINNAGNTNTTANKNYQIGKVTKVPTKKVENAIDFYWDTHVDLPNKAGQACVMINANDGTVDQSETKTFQSRVANSEIMKVTYDNINPDAPKLTPVNESFDKVSVTCEVKSYNFVINPKLKKNPTYFLCGPTGTEQLDLAWSGASDSTLEAYQVDNHGNQSTLAKAALAAKFACGDGIDNDSDGKTDKEDPGCWSDPNDPNTYNPNDDDEVTYVCSDGIDNDKDGTIDGFDTTCWTNPNDSTTYNPKGTTEGELSACADGVDNDNDGKKDKEDPGCWTNPNDPNTYDPNDNNEADPVQPPKAACADGVDNDNDGKVDANDPGCWTDPNNPNTYNPNDNSEVDPPKAACADGVDNDNDGKVDANDPGCWSNPNDPNTYNPNDNNEAEAPKAACADGVDNDNDGKVDANDPGCWTNPNDPNTYNPNDTSETDPKPSAPEQTETGAVVYDETQDPVKDANRRCLEYTPTRNLTFTDMTISDVGGKEAVILKNTILRLGLQAGQYALSGYGSDAGNSGKATIGLKQPLTRLEWAKLLMITHCFSIFDTDSLPQVTYSGEAMPSYKDFPRGTRKGWESDIIYSASYYNIWNGTLENNIEYNRPIKISEAIKMLVRAGEFRQGFEYPVNPSAVKQPVTPSDWYYEFYAKAPNVSHLNSPFVRTEANTIRNESFGFLLDALLTRSVYSEEDEALVKSLR